MTPSVPVFSSNGHAIVGEAHDAAEDERAACTVCGSRERHVFIAVEDTALAIHESVILKARHEGGGKPFREIRAGEFPSQATSSGWAHKHQVFDRSEDLYSEVVTDPDTRKVLHRCEEPLSEHRGYGSARSASE